MFISLIRGFINSPKMEYFEFPQFLLIPYNTVQRMVSMKTLSGYLTFQREILKDPLIETFFDAESVQLTYMNGTIIMFMIKPKIILIKYNVLFSEIREPVKLRLKYFFYFTSLHTRLSATTLRIFIRKKKAEKGT